MHCLEQTNNSENPNRPQTISKLNQTKSTDRYSCPGQSRIGDSVCMFLVVRSDIWEAESEDHRARMFECQKVSGVAQMQ